MSLTVPQAAGLQTSKYFNAAGIAILTYDYVITIEDEIRWVWGRKWDATRIVFTVSRYLPFVGMGMTAYAALRSASQPCPPSLEENIIHTLGIIAAEVLLVLRTYAFWQGDKRVLYGLFAYAAATIGAAVAINVTPIRLIPGGNPPSGCLLIASRNSTFVYLFLLVFEIVILFLTAYKRFTSYRDVRTPIIYTIYRDGMFYIVCIILVTLANTLVDGIFPSQFSDLLDLPQIALHSVLASRILFNLRKNSHNAQKGETMDSVTLSGITHDTPSGSQPTASGTESSASQSRGVTSIYIDVDIELEHLEPHWDPSVSRV